jgi:hypothetical protein
VRATVARGVGEEDDNDDDEFLGARRQWLEREPELDIILRRRRG